MNTKMITKFMKGLSLAFLSVILSVCFTGCGEDAGLGSSVDTEAPMLSITYPPSLAIIKGKFLLAGVWSDDKLVSSVSVEVYKTADGSDNILVDSTTASVGSNGKWSVLLNEYDSEKYAAYNGWKFCDGDYEIQVTARDDAGHHSGTAARAFSIDNSAPVLVLTKPATSGSSASPESFGQIIQLTGSFYDLCNKISTLKVSFYDSTGNAIGDSSFSNITSLSDSSPLTIAHYYSNSSDRQAYSQIYNNYASLLGSDNISAYESGSSISDVKIYFTVTAYDGAKIYLNSEDSGTGEGNKTTTFYRGITSMQNLISGDDETVGSFSPADLGAYLNKTSSDFTQYASTIDSILEISKSVSTDTSETPVISDTANDDVSAGPVYLTFNVNPMNNPLYTAGGYECVSVAEAAEDTDTYSEEGYKRVYEGAPVPVSLTVGADHKNIKTSTVSIYRIDKTKYSGAVSKDMFTKENYDAGYFTLLWTWNEDVKNEASEWGIDVSGIYTYASTETNVSSLSKQLSVSDFEAGHNYQFFVTGTDISGKELVSVNTAGYGFCGAVSTSAPVIKATEGKKLNSVVSGEAFTGNVSSLDELLYVAGTISSSAVVNSLSYSLTVTDSGNSLNKTTHSGNINVEKVAAAPDYSGDFASSYCYTTNDSSSSITYYWRFTTAGIASEFTSVIGTGDYEVSLTLAADNGATGSFSRTFTLDTQNPVPELSAVSPSSESGSSYWINPKNDFTVTGLVTDNLSTAKACTNWIKLVALTAADTEESSASYTSENLSGVNKWSFTVHAESVDSGYYGANLYMYSKDSAGNIGVSTPVTLKFDITPPKALHAEDGKGKDVYFRIGEADNDDIDSDNELWNDAYDKNAGSKYSGNTFGNSTTIRIRGNFLDEGSGVKMIYYKLFKTEPEDSQITDFFDNYETKKDGYFAPLSEVETKRVFYTGIDGNDEGVIGEVSDGDDDPGAQTKVEKGGSVTVDGKTKYWALIDSNFNTTISGLQVGKNYIALVAVDNVGNVSKDAVTVKTDTGSYIKYNNVFLNVDTESPILVCSESGQQYTNGVSAITVNGTYSDLPASENSGVSKITLAFSGESETTATAVIYDEDGNRTTDSNGKYTWAAIIPASKISSLTQGETYNVNGTVTDAAGNSSSSTLFTLSFDKESPEVSISTPSTETKINGKMELTGKVTSEGSSPVKLVLYASTAVPDGDFTDTTKFKEVSEITDVSKIYSWSFTDIDTYDLTEVASAPTTAILYFIPVVTDGAGNNNVYDLATSSFKYTEGINYFKYTVDMDSDRPTVKVTNLTNSGTDSDPVYILKYGEKAKIEGTVSDDDSTSSSAVKTFIASSSPITSADGATGITTFNAATGEFTFTPADTADGEKTVYFYIIDNADTVFYTAKTITVSEADYNYEQPYFQFKTSTAVDSSTALSYKSDATAPTIQNTQIQAYDSSKTENGTAAAPGTSLCVGGVNKKYIKMTVTGYDANGIDGIRLTLNYKKASDGSAEELKIASGTVYEEEGFSQSGTVTGTTTAVWTTDYLDLSGIETGSVSGTIEVFDKSGLLGTSSSIFNVDNSGPAVTITTPSSNEELTGDITFAGTSTDAGNAGTLTTAWLIPTLAQAAMSDANLASAVDGEGNSIWNDTLDDDKTVNVWAFTVKAEKLDLCDNSTYTTTVANEIYTLPFYIKTTDSLGNVTIDRNKKILHNPNADRPKTEISYPNASNYGTDIDGNKVAWVTLGGAIRITGSSIIPSNTTTVNSVYLQVINGTNNLANSGTYTKTSAWASSHGLTVMTKAQVQSSVGKTLTLADEFDWGIKADKTGSWNITINENGEMNPAADELTYIAIRACAVNAEGKAGTWTDWYYINIDNTAPGQKGYLYQFESAPQTNSVAAATVLASSNITSSQEYGGSDVYLKGDWFLTVKLQDESELKSFSVTKNLNGGTTVLSSGTDYFASTQGTEDSKVTQYLFIPVDKSSSSVEYTVIVKDSDHTISRTYSLNIDNDAPEINYVYKGSSLLEDSSNVLSDVSNTVTDSNYMYTLGGVVEETASGFERLAFYFVRAKAIDGTTYTTESVLDPLVTTGTADAKAAIDGNLTARPFTQGDDTFYLYSKAVSGTMNADGYTFTPSTAADVTGNAHIRKGGLIEIGGLLRKITDINSTSGAVTFNTSTGVTSDTTATAYFPYAQIVDNTATESVDSQSANPFTFKNSSDDGDLMPETLTGSKSVGYSWDATIHSYNIPDGPCALVVLAFDKAGNVSGKTYPVKVENSAPRLAKVFLGTDLDSSGTWTAGEFEAYNLYDANTTYGIETTEVKASQEISTASYGSAFKIKDKLAVIAEIVGGNITEEKPLMMVYGRGASTTAAVPSSGTGAGVTAAPDNTLASLVSSQKIGSVSYNKATKSTSLYGYTLTNAQIVAAVTEANDGTGKKASFTFWDSTDELVQGSTSQNCVLLVNDFTIDLVDSVPPRVVVNPFYWESASKNSIYGNSASNGHIELEGDLTGTAAATLYGSDPKVSGKITFTGTAYDEHSLKKLKFTLANSSGTALTGFADIAMGTYDSTSTSETYLANGGWSALSGNSGAAVSSTGSYEWTISTAATDASRWYEDTAYMSQGGHKIYWTISIDTAQIPNVAEQNIKLTVTATDKAGTASTGAAASAPDTTDGAYIVTDGTTHVPSYQMDVVPYITGIKTTVRKASGLKDNNIRSASGKYSILANNSDNTITVTGFNFNTGALVAKIADASTSAATAITSTAGGTSLTITASDTSTAVITNSGITKSGYLELFSKTVRALNNINSNDAHGSFTRTESVEDYRNMPNRVNEADFYTTKNVMLTDDRYLRFFDMKNTGVKNGYYPVMIMNGNNPVFGYVDNSGGKNSAAGTAAGTGAGTYRYANAQAQRAEFDEDGDEVYIEYLVKQLNTNQMGMAMDSAGRFLQATVYDYESAGFALYYDRYNEIQTSNYGYGWGPGTGYNQYPGNYAYETGNNAIVLETCSYSDGSYESGRYQNPKLIMDGNSRTGTAKVYMTYFDAATGELLFRNFQLGNTVSGTARNLDSQGTAKDGYTYAQKINFAENSQNSGYWNYYRNGNQYARYNNDTYNTGRLSVTSTGTKNFDMGVTDDGHVIIVYFDSDDNILKLLYSTNAVDGTSPTSAVAWTTSTVEFPENIGTYVSMTLDGDAVHIAAFDSYDSNLVYMYLPSYDSTSLQSVTIDQASAVGNWTQIKVKDHVPYIAYYNATETGGRDPVKLAYASSAISGTSATVPFGVDVKPGTAYAASGTGQATGYTTGSWE
ncbi:hypothetical protein, partial [Treponema sp.]|uniref:hypothetical protein n=1 Tax=Treponema sp. TaxID=166 RepID=UPI00388EFFE9